MLWASPPGIVTVTVGGEFFFGTKSGAAETVALTQTCSPSLLTTATPTAQVPRSIATLTAFVPQADALEPVVSVNW